MKKVILSLALLAAIGVTSCKEKTNTEAEAEIEAEIETVTETQAEEVAVAHYQCPMKCEGDKTYTDKDTKCPVCGMALTEVKKEEE